MKKDNKNSYGLVQKDNARIRVDARGSAYIPSQEIASLPEVKAMQQRAASIVGQYQKNLSSIRASSGAISRKEK